MGIFKKREEKFQYFINADAYKSNRRFEVKIYYSDRYVHMDSVAYSTFSSLEKAEQYIADFPQYLKDIAVWVEWEEENSREGSW